jgi:orotate phosphoribosyltransferase
MKKQAYLEILLKQKVLQFGEFKTKSGRLSPYFFNTGNIDSGNSIARVSELYANVIAKNYGPDVNVIFGPAYKGIPLCVMVAAKLSELSGRDIKFTFNRKEAKDHGEGGNLVGHHINESDRVIIVEDVLTAGTSINESGKLLKKLNTTVLAAVVGIDRQEKGSGTASAREQITKTWGFPVHALINLNEIIATLWNKEFLGKVWIDDDHKGKIDAYMKSYCA